MKSLLERFRAVARRVNVPIVQKFAWDYEYRNHEAQPQPCPVSSGLILENVPMGSTIVELGCGGGVLAQEVYHRGWAGRYIGIDLSDEAIARAKKRCPQGEWKVGDMRSPLGFRPDTLVLIDSVYYLSPDRARTVLENAEAKITICRIFDRFAYKAHSDMLLSMDFQEHKVGHTGGVFFRAVARTGKAAA